MTVYSVREAKAQFSALLDRAARGEPVEIVRRSGKRDRFRLLLVEQAGAVRQPGALKGAVMVPEGFDDEDADVTAAFEGRG